MLRPALDRGEDLAGIAFEPVPIERLSDYPELDDEVGGEVLGLDLTALFPPQAVQGGYIAPHNGAGV